MSHADAAEHQPAASHTKKFKEIKLSESYSNHTNPEPENNQNNPSNGVSLGIESLNDDVSLLCN